MCPDIKWHFIGHLQSNKVNKLLGVPNLYMLQTVDSKKLADAVDKAWAKKQEVDPLKIMIQVNTSGEESKSGISPDELYELTQHVIGNCHNLSLVGFMTIGYAQYDLTLAPNPEFLALANYKEIACQKFNLDADTFGLSMGMSHDFEHAIENGSTCIRIGSSIFGSRNVKAQ
ncbi:Proline synthase co-transcribed bacterial-like protein, partial [Stegodyphus mimosarum]